MAPFTVLNVCMGNICRSPMAERLFAQAVRNRVATEPAEQLLRSFSAGTGGWHEGEEMNPPAARQVRARGGSVDGFEARKLRGSHLDEADLILTATADQYDYVVALRPEAATRTFVLGEFGRLLPGVHAEPLPVAEPKPDAVYARGWRSCRRWTGCVLVRPLSPVMTWTTRGVVATRRSSGSATKSRTRQSRSPRFCSPDCFYVLRAALSHCPKDLDGLTVYG